MTLLTYTTHSEVRAVLGVSATEMPDKVLSHPMYDLQVVLALESVAEGIPTLFNTLLAVSSNALTSDQKRFTGLVGLFAPYAIAKHLLSSLPMFAVQALTDGRAGFDRNTDASIYDKVKADVSASLSDIKLMLAASYYKASNLAEPTVAVRMPVLTVLSVRGVDPVTNI